jgi:hypothetical protein
VHTSRYANVCRFLLGRCWYLKERIFPLHEPRMSLLTGGALGVRAEVVARDRWEHAVLLRDDRSQIFQGCIRG